MEYTSYLTLISLLFTVNLFMFKSGKCVNKWTRLVQICVLEVYYKEGWIYEGMHMAVFINSCYFAVYKNRSGDRKQLLCFKLHILYGITHNHATFTLRAFCHANDNDV